MCLELIHQYTQCLSVKSFFAFNCRSHFLPQSDELMRQYFVQREEEQREMRRLVEETMAGHQNTKEAKAKLQLMKQKIGEHMITLYCYLVQ